MPDRLFYFLPSFFSSKNSRFPEDFVFPVSSILNIEQLENRKHPDFLFLYIFCKGDSILETIFNALTFFGNEFALFVISMVPIVELRGAVPLGATLGMPWFEVLAISVIGNMFPVPFLLLFGRKILDWLKTVPLLSKPAHWYEEKLVKKAGKINEYAKWGLFLLVAIPLPGTGAWTGVLAATFLNMKMRQAFPMIFLGVLAAGIIMTVGSYGLLGAIQLF